MIIIYFPLFNGEDGRLFMDWMKEEEEDAAAAAAATEEDRDREGKNEEKSKLIKK